VPAPRPGWATSDRAYFFVVAGFLAAAVGALGVIRRGRLGRLLRAMADSPVALETYGTSVTALKVTVFALAAFMAGIGGALLGPVTGTASPSTFGFFQSLLAVVVLTVAPGGEIASALGAAVLLTVVPSYVTSATANEYLTGLFGLGAVAMAVARSGTSLPGRLMRSALARRPSRSRHPAVARLAAREAA
jgi:ABC-type branched-subunit amino acid transport system permease subunit